MNIWAIANQKGGVGKTTTAVSLAGWCALRGLPTLMVDLDPHGSLTAYFGLNPETVESGVYTLFQRKETRLAEVVQRTRFENLWFAPASLGLATLDRQIGAQEGMGLVLSRALAQAQQEFAMVIIDCPPMLGVPMVNALAACTHLVIPVQTEFLALQGLERMLRTLTMITRAKKASTPFTIVPTLFDRRTRAGQQNLAALKERFDTNLSQAIIPVDTLFREASRIGAPLSMSAPESRGAIAYAGLLQELFSGTSGKRSAAAQAVA